MDIEHTQSKVDFPCQKREHEVQEASAKALSREQIEKDFSMMRAVDTYKQTGKYPTGMADKKGPASQACRYHYTRYSSTIET